MPSLALVVAESLLDPKGWSNDQVLYLLGTIVVPILLASLGWVGWLLRRNRDVHSELEKKSKDLREARDEIQNLQTSYALAQAHAKAEADQAAAKTTEADEQRSGRDQAEKKLRAFEVRMRRILRVGGEIWAERLLRNVPPFRPLPERRTPIISVLNLKGGTGKTTTVANLGAAFAGLGYRVLLVDLDLQGSLSGMFLTWDEHHRLHEEKRLVPHLFEKGEERVFPDPVPYCQPIWDGRSGLLATADTQAYAELRLTAAWLFRMAKRDPRFLLRKALHQKRLTRRFDVILIDCPPLLNVSCVNALAASDAMLIPVLLARKTTERVVALLEIVRSIRDRVNANLGVLGVLANRINPRGSLTAVESNAWDALRDQYHGAWVEKVNLFETTIRQSVEIRDAEAESRCLGPDDEVHASFRALAEEIEGRLPPYSLPPKRLSARREVAP